MLALRGRTAGQLWSREYRGEAGQDFGFCSKSKEEPAVMWAEDSNQEAPTLTQTDGCGERQRGESRSWEEEQLHGDQ